MQKILILGNGGAGKSTLARRMSEILDIPVYHLDVYYWNPGWKPTPDEEWIPKAEQLLSGDSWIIDGNYSSTLKARVEVADTIIFMDLPLLLSLARIVKRRIMYHGKSRPDMREGCDEKLDMEFIKWVTGFCRRSRPRIQSMLEEAKSKKNVIILKSRAQVKRFIKNLESSNIKGEGAKNDGR